MPVKDPRCPENEDSISSGASKFKPFRVNGLGCPRRPADPRIPTEPDQA